MNSEIIGLNKQPHKLYVHVQVSNSRLHVTTYWFVRRDLLV